MKLFRGDWSFVITYNLILLLVVISTGNSELLNLLLINIFLIFVQIVRIYKKNNNINDFQKNKNYGESSLNSEYNEEILNWANDFMFDRLKDEDKKIWLIKQYIGYLVLIRKIRLISENKNDLEDLKHVISKCSEKTNSLDKIEYLLKLEETADKKNLRYLRQVYYEKKLNETCRDLDKDNLFEENYNFFFNLDEVADNEMVKYVETGIFGDFSSEFQLKMNVLFNINIDFNQFYYDILEYIYEGLWIELYEANNIKNI